MKTVYLLSFFILITLPAWAQTGFSMELYAGSNAPWGESQYITIDAKGNVFYTLSEVGKGVKDSLKFKITQTQVNELSTLLNSIQFFRLKEKYNEASRDGTRLSVLASVSGKKNKVHWINIHTAESDQLAAKLNAMLKTKNLSLLY